MKKTLIGLSAVVILVIAGMFVFLLTLDVNQYKDDIVQAVSEATGRDFEIEGDLSLGVSLFPTVVVQGVSLGNAEWGSEADMLNVEHFEASISLLPLLSGNVQVDELILLQPEILLETDKEGKGNWILDISEEQIEAQEETEDSELPNLDIDDVFIKDAKLTFKNGQTGESQELVLKELQIKSDSWLSPMQLSLTATYEDIPINITGTSSPIGDLIKNNPFELALLLKVADMEINLDGKVRDLASIKGLDFNVTASAQSLHELGKLALVELPETGAITFNANLIDTDDGYYIKSFSGRLGESDIAGELDINLSQQRPSVKATLASEQIDLSPFESEETKEGKKEKVFSADPLPLESLLSANADVKIER